MASYNKTILMGNITKTPELRSIPGSDTVVTRTGLAVNRKYKEKDETMFIDIVFFGKNAENLVNYVSKGDPLLIEGRLSMNSWEQSDGTKRVKHEVIVDTFQMLGNRKDKEDDVHNEPPVVKKSNEIDEDDIPF